MQSQQKKKWYQYRAAKILFHALAWYLFFSLPNILSMTPGPNGKRVIFRTGPGPREAIGTFPMNQDKIRFDLPDSQRMEKFGRIPPGVSAGFAATPPFTLSPVHLASNLVQVLLFYLNAFLLIPRFLNRRKYILYFSLVVLAFLGTNMLIQAAMWAETGAPFPFRGHFLFNYLPFLLIITASLLYFYIREKMVNDRVQEAKEKEQLKTELVFLRSQISPHFLFNVMNSAVSQARAKSGDLEDTLIRISQLLRYMIYETGVEKVSLEKEAEYLNNYIELQLLRFGDQVSLEFNKHIEESRIEIEPMLLIPFVENAFKHGIGNVKDPKIIIHLNADNRELHFEVRNRFNPQQLTQHDQNSGIGLPNIQRRLELLYPNKHKLNLQREDNWFIAKLSLYLS